MAVNPISPVTVGINGTLKMETAGPEVIQLHPPSGSTFAWNPSVLISPASQPSGPAISWITPTSGATAFLPDKGTYTLLNLTPAAIDVLRIPVPDTSAFSSFIGCVGTRCSAINILDPALGTDTAVAGFVIVLNPDFYRRKVIITNAGPPASILRVGIGSDIALANRGLRILGGDSATIEDGAWLEITANVEAGAPLLGSLSFLMD